MDKCDVEMFLTLYFMTYFPGVMSTVVSGVE